MGAGSRPNDVGSTGRFGKGRSLRVNPLLPAAGVRTTGGVVRMECRPGLTTRRKRGTREPAEPSWQLLQGGSHAGSAARTACRRSPPASRSEKEETMPGQQGVAGESDLSARRVVDPVFAW